MEYVAAENYEVLGMVCDELENEFATSYVTVVVDGDVLDKVGENNTKEYLKTHTKDAAWLHSERESRIRIGDRRRS